MQNEALKHFSLCDAVKIQSVLPGTPASNNLSCLPEGQHTKQDQATTTNLSIIKQDLSNPRKRAIPTDEDGFSEPPKEGEGSDRKCHNKDLSTRVKSHGGYNYACPFYRNDPDNSGLPEGCRSRGIKPYKLKEHIRRKHTKPVQCSNCGLRGDAGTIAKHVQGHTCRQRSYFWRVDEEMLEKDRKLREARGEPWHHIFGILFPNRPIPPENDQWFSEDNAHGHKCLIEGLTSFLKRTFPDLLHSFRNSDEYKGIQNPSTESIFRASLDPVADVARFANMVSTASLQLDFTPFTATPDSMSTPGSKSVLCPPSISTPEASPCTMASLDSSKFQFETLDVPSPTNATNILQHVPHSQEPIRASQSEFGEPYGIDGWRMQPGENWNDIFLSKTLAETTDSGARLWDERFSPCNAGVITSAIPGHCSTSETLSSPSSDVGEIADLDPLWML